MQPEFRRLYDGIRMFGQKTDLTADNHQVSRSSPPLTTPVNSASSRPQGRFVSSWPKGSVSPTKVQFATKQEEPVANVVK